MNILICNSAKVWGGNERWSFSLANGFSGREHNIFVVARADIFSSLSDNIQLDLTDFKHEFNTKTYLKLSGIIKKNNIDIIVATKLKEYFICGLLGKLFNIPVVMRFGIERSVSKFDLLRRISFANFASKIIVNSKSIKTILEKSNIDSHKIEVVYNGYDFKNNLKIEDFSHDKFIKQKNFIFGAVGRLSPQKGFDILIESARNLKGDFQIFIAGDGPDKEKYLNLIEKYNLQEKIILLGEIKNVRAFLKECDCTIIPSRSEGIPNVMMESWSVKTPVIASRMSGNPEAIDDGLNGRLFDLNIKDLGKLLQEIILDNNIISDFGRAGFETLNSDFSMKKMLDTCEDMFNKLRK
jgi:L-malate glycosyltransferase